MTAVVKNLSINMLTSFGIACIGIHFGLPMAFAVLFGFIAFCFIGAAQIGYTQNPSGPMLALIGEDMLFFAKPVIVMVGLFVAQVAVLQVIGLPSNFAGLIAFVATAFSVAGYTAHQTQYAAKRIEA